MKTDLEKLKLLESQATKAPWKFIDGDGNQIIISKYKSIFALAGISDETENFRLVVEMRNSLPSLIAELKAARCVVHESKLFCASERHMKLVWVEASIKAYEAAIGEKV